MSSLFPLSSLRLYVEIGFPKNIFIINCYCHAEILSFDSCPFIGSDSVHG